MRDIFLDFYLQENTMLENFRAYRLAVSFYKIATVIKLPTHLQDQLDRAASSIALNLAEGAGRFSRNDQKRFFHIAFGSLRECQAILDITGKSPEAVQLADSLAAHIYKLIKSWGCKKPRYS